MATARVGLGLWWRNNLFLLLDDVDLSTIYDCKRTANIKIIAKMIKSSTKANDFLLFLPQKGRKIVIYLAIYEKLCNFTAKLSIKETWPKIGYLTYYVTNMGYAGRMLAKHNPWLIFGLWVGLVGLLNVSIYALKQGLAFLFIIESTTYLVGSITYSLFPLSILCAKIMDFNVII